MAFKKRALKVVAVGLIGITAWWHGYARNPTFTQLPEVAQQAIIDEQKTIEHHLERARHKISHGNFDKANEEYKLIRDLLDAQAKSNPSFRPLLKEFDEFISFIIQVERQTIIVGDRITRINSLIKTEDYRIIQAIAAPAASDHMWMVLNSYIRQTSITDPAMVAGMKKVVYDMLVELRKQLNTSYHNLERQPQSGMRDDALSSLQRYIRQIDMQIKNFAP